MELTGIVIFIAFIVVCWRESKATALRGSAERAVLECEEEIQRLREAIMSGASAEVWQRDAWERHRQDVLMALDRFHAARLGDKYERELTRRSIPSFQDEAEWRKCGVLARGPFGQHADKPAGAR